jgi:hypothetical protein
VFRLPRRSHARHLYQRIDELTQRIERLEGNQARIQSDVATQLRHADIAIEDLVAALEEVRARAEAPEPPR